LATGSSADELDEYLKIGETTAMEAMKNFVKGVRDVFGERYLRRPTMEDTERLYDRGVLRDVVLACIVLHNMIVEDEKEKDIIEENLDLNMPPSSSTFQEPEFSPDQNVPLERVLEKDTSIRDQSAHRRLKNDLVEHI